MGRVSEGPQVEKELHVFRRRPVRLEPREGCWAGGGNGKVGRTVGVIGEKEVTGAGSWGLVFELSPQRTGKLLDDFQQRAMASSLFIEDSFLWCEA